MEKYQKLVKGTLGLAFVLGLGLSSFNQPSLAVASSASYDAEALSSSTVTVILGEPDPYLMMAPIMFTGSPNVALGPDVTVALGSKDPILVPQVFDKLFDY